MRSFDGADLLPHEVGELHEVDLLGVHVLQRFGGRARGEAVEGVDADAEIGRIGLLDDAPRADHVVDVPAPRQAFERHLDAVRQRHHRQLAQVARDRRLLVRRVAAGGGARY
jgi:hypothetical protein